MPSKSIRIKDADTRARTFSYDYLECLSRFLESKDIYRKLTEWFTNKVNDPSNKRFFDAVILGKEIRPTTYYCAYEPVDH